MVNTTIIRTSATVPSVSSSTPSEKAPSDLVREVFERRESVLKATNPELVDTYLSQKYPRYADEKAMLVSMREASQTWNGVMPMIVGVDVTGVQEFYMTATVVFESADETKSLSSFSLSFIRQRENWVLLGEVEIQLAPAALSRILASGS